MLKKPSKYLQKNTFFFANVYRYFQMEVEPLTAENSTLKEISISIFPVSIVQAKLQELE